MARLTDADRKVYALIERAATGDTRPFIETLLRIQDKGGKVIPFHYNAVQNDYWAKRTSNDIVLKPRQVGFTTEIQGEFLADALVIPGLEVVYTAQRDDSAKRLFEITQRMFHNLPDGLRPDVVSDSTHMLQIKQGKQISTIEIGTAGSESFGRGRPVNRYLASEVAFYGQDEENTMAGIVAAMPIHESIGTRVVKESTANGMAGMYYKDWLKAKAGTSADTPHFYPWYYMEEYQLAASFDLDNLSENEIDLIAFALKNYQINLTVEQIAWRRWQIAQLGEAMFKQEYPETPEDAFMAVGGVVFSSSLVNRVAAQGEQPPVYLVDSIPQTDDAYMAYWEKYPMPGSHYAIAVDQSSGQQVDDDNKPIDYQVAYVSDVDNNRQVATLRGHIGQSLFADLIARLHKHFNNALVVPERNLAQYGFIDMLRDRNVDVYFHYADKKFGYPVNGGTKPILIDHMRDLMKAGAVIIRSANIISELRTFLYLKGGDNNPKTTGAPAGAHDDELVTALLANAPSVVAQAKLVYIGDLTLVGYHQAQSTTVGAVI